MGKMNRGTVSWLDNARLENIAPVSNWVPLYKQYRPRQNSDTSTDEACVKKAEQRVREQGTKQREILISIARSRDIVAFWTKNKKKKPLKI